MTNSEHATDLLKQSAVWLAYLAKTDVSATNRQNAQALLNEIEAFCAVEKQAA